MCDLLPPESNLVIDLGVITEVRSILRNPTEEDELSAINNAKKCVTWKDEQSDSALHTYFIYPAEENDGTDPKWKQLFDGEVTNCPRKKRDHDNGDDGVLRGESDDIAEDVLQTVDSGPIDKKAEGVEEEEEEEESNETDQKSRSEHIIDYNESIFSDEVSHDDEKTEEAKKKCGRNGGRQTKKKSNGRPQTEEEVIAEIGRKIMDAGKKANRMKQLKIEEAERRREKKNDEKRKSDEKKRMKEEEMDIENQKKEEDKINEVECKPKSRAEAARRTKALLTMGSEEEGRTTPDEEDDEDPKRKKRKYRKRTKPVPFMRRLKDVKEDESNVGCGKYIENPNDVTVQTVCRGNSLEEESEVSVDEILSVPSEWMNCEEKESIHSHTFHPRAHMKRHVGEVQELSDSIIDEYRDMVQRLDGMKLNLFADSTIRRFDPRVVRNMEMLSATGMWPDGLLPQPDRLIPKCQYLMWNTPYKRFVRILPSHKQKDNLTSREIDLMSGGGAERVTKSDLVKNLNDLIMSKMKKTSCKPLPTAGNPFDVPEISTRIKAMNAQELQSASRVPAMSLMPCEYMNKKRKKTRKEALFDLANAHRRNEEKSESIYKEDVREGEEEDGYQYEWDEMGEILENRNHHPYDGELGVDVDGDVVMKANAL